MKKIISIGITKSISSTQDDIDNLLPLFFDNIFNRFSLGMSDTLTPYYKQLFEIIYNWSNISFDQLYLKPVQSIDMPDSSVKIKTFYVGDIHGEINHLMFNLIGSGVFQFNMSGPPFLMFDSLNKRAYDFFQLMSNPIDNCYHFQLIPNLIFSGNDDSRVVILGDVLDRGPYMDQCLSLILYLLDQQKQLRMNNEMESKQLFMVLGDHEIYGINPDVTLFPNYKIPVGMPFFVKHSAQHSLRHTFQILNDAFMNGDIEYAYYGVNQEYGAHSTITPSFLNHIVDSLNDPNFCLLNERLDLVQKLTFINNVNDILDSSKTTDSLPEVISFLNVAFKELAFLLAVDSKVLFSDRMRLICHPMIVIDDMIQSSIWARPFSEKKPENSINYLGIVGHSSLPNGICQSISVNSKPKVISVDVQASWIYRYDQQLPYSRARLTYWDPNLNQLIHLRLSQEKHCFVNGLFLPNENKKGIYKKILKFFSYLPIISPNK